MTDLLTALRDLVEQWRDDSWDQQRSGRPELRDLTKTHADTLDALLREHTDGDTDARP